MTRQGVGAIADGEADAVTGGVAAIVAVKNIAVDNILLGKGVVGTCCPCTAVDGQYAVTHIAHGVGQ